MPYAFDGDVFTDVVREYPDITVHSTHLHAIISEGVSQKIKYNDLQCITPDKMPDLLFCQTEAGILNEIRKEKGR